MIKHLEQLSNLHGVASHEKAIQNYIVNHISESLDVSYDALGSVIVHKKGSGKKVMLVAHMDEVGFLIRNITPQGRCTLMPLGGVIPSAYSNQKMIVTNYYGEQYPCYLQSTYTDNKPTNTYLDFGYDTKEELLQNVDIRPGDFVTFASTFTKLNDNRYMGKAMDDRTGCTVLLDVLEKYQGDLDLYVCFTSSEEVGTRGSKTCASMIQPDYGIVVDVASPHEPFDFSYKNTRQLGKGPMLELYDKSCIDDPELAHMVYDISINKHIPIQADMLQGGGTDAGSIQLTGKGVKVITLGIPLRYCHTSYSIVDIRDLENCSKLILSLLEKLYA